MTSTVFEIIELSEGEFVLQRSDEANEPLVSIKFSAEAMEYLAANSADIAKVMIEAGIHEVENMMDDQITASEAGHRGSRVLH